MHKFLIALFAVSFALPALALEDSVLRDIKRCDSMKELSEKADDIAEDFNFGGLGPEELAATAAKFQAYMAYIAVRQNGFLAEALAAPAAPAVKE